jgi:thiol-disulfide isomerase/thioredoxin
MDRFLRNIDQFRTVSKDITHGGVTGGMFTAVAYAVLCLLLVAELGAFLKVTYQTDVFLDENNDATLQINFDVTMYDLPCKYLKVEMYDKFGQEKLNVSTMIKFQSLDHTGANMGKPYTAQEIAVLEQVDEATDVTEDEKKELDADWSSSSDHFKHNDFDKAVTFHDYTIVNFYAEWCVHCRQFHPMWMQAAAQMNEKTEYEDADGQKTTVKFLKMNCVDFGEVCQKAQIQAFPSIRLYKKDGTFESFRQKRSIEAIDGFLRDTIKSSHLIVSKHHAIFSEGCQVSGQMFVPRVPGHFQLQADAHSGDVAVNPALTNVSHAVNHFSFGPKQQLFLPLMSVPKDVVSHLSPLDGKSFIAERFHEAPQHYLKVVSTHLEKRSTPFYQMTHTDRIRKLRKDKKVVPQARFTWDFSPMSITVKTKTKKWYEFVTSLFAILGGTYTIVEIFSGAVDTAVTTVKDALGKAE